jgi:hypothetical protein
LNGARSHSPFAWSVDTELHATSPGGEVDRCTNRHCALRRIGDESAGGVDALIAIERESFETIVYAAQAPDRFRAAMCFQGSANNVKGSPV